MLALVALLAILFGGLVLWLWPSQAGEEDPWTTIYRTGDPGEIALIKSIFNEEKIPLLVKGEGVQDLFGIGRLGTGYNMITGPVEIQVPESCMAQSRELLETMESQIGHS